MSVIMLHWRPWLLFVCLAELLLASGLMAVAPTLANGATVAEAAKKNGLNMFLAAANQIPEVSGVITSTEGKCTVFAPDDQAYKASLQMLGAKAGLAVQNTTIMRIMVQHHMLPVALSSKQLRNVTRVRSMANETMYIYNQGGKLWVYSNYQYPVPLQVTDIKAGNCYIHTINRTVIAPSLSPLLEGWSKSTGNMPPVPDKSAWAPKQEPLPGTPHSIEGADAGSTTSSSDNTAGTAAPPAAKANSAARDTGGRVLSAFAGALALAAAVL